MADSLSSPVTGDSPPLPGSNGSQRLLFSHDLVYGTYRGQSRFALVRLMHGEESESEDEEEEEVVVITAEEEDDEAGGRRRRDGGGEGGVQESPGTDTAGEASRFGPLKRGYVRVQWYPEGVRQDVKETKKPHCYGRCDWDRETFWEISKKHAIYCLRMSQGFNTM